MPAVVRLGDTCTGHDCFPPRECISGSDNVFANNLPAHRVNDTWSVHTCTHPGVPHGQHDSIQATGSNTVFVNGRAWARVGDSVACGSSNATGSPNVFAN